MSYHRIEEKLEDAFQTALLTEYGGTLTSSLISGGSLDGFYIFKGFSLDEFKTPAVSIACVQSGPADSATAVITGNQSCMLGVTVYGHKGESTRDGHAEAVSLVRDLIYAPDLVALLNSAGVADFTAMFARPGTATRDVKGNMLATTVTVRVTCKPS